MEQTPEHKLLVIMLIDDNTMDLYINTHTIKKCGKSTTVSQFSMGTDAMEFLQTNKDNIENIPDIMMLDINMPQMDGFAFLEEYENLPSHVKSKCKIHILSSSFDPEDRRKANENPSVVSFIEKPLTKEIVSDRLSQLSG